MNKLRKLVWLFEKLENEKIKYHKKRLEEAEHFRERKVKLSLKVVKLHPSPDIACSICKQSGVDIYIPTIETMNDREFNIFEHICKEIGEDITTFGICLKCMEVATRKGRIKFEILNNDELTRVLEKF
jgi:hypothetical protein